MLLFIYAHTRLFLEWKASSFKLKALNRSGLTQKSRISAPYKTKELSLIKPIQFADSCHLNCLEVTTLLSLSTGSLR
jgi:hypothetical protein